MMVFSAERDALINRREDGNRVPCGRLITLFFVLVHGSMHACMSEWMGGRMDGWVEK